MANIKRMMELGEEESAVEEEDDDSVLSATFTSLDDDDDDDVVSAEIQDDNDKDDNNDDEDPNPEGEVLARKQPPKMRIKLSLRMGKSSSSSPKTTNTRTNSASSPVGSPQVEEDLQATVVPSSDEEEEDGEVVVESQPIVSTSSVKTEDSSTSTPKSKKPKLILSKRNPNGNSSASKKEKKSSGTKRTIEKISTSKKKASSPTSNTSSNKSKDVNGKNSNFSKYTRPVRFPPISSPGLLMQLPSNIPISALLSSSLDNKDDKNSSNDEKQQLFNNTSSGYVTPSSVFNYTMKAAGYTATSRTEHPHRGSSMQLTVADMFDSNANTSVFSASSLPSIIPSKLFKSCKKQPKKQSSQPITSKGNSNPTNGSFIKQEQEIKMNDQEEQKHDDTRTLSAIFLRALDHTLNKSKNATKKRRILLKAQAAAQDRQTKLVKEENDCTGRQNLTTMKRSIPRFTDMIPVSLTIPLSDSYIESRLNYINLVEIREKAIVSSQKAQDATQDAREAYFPDAKVELVKKVAQYEEEKKQRKLKEGDSVDKSKKEDTDEEAEFGEEKKIKKNEDAPPVMRAPPQIPAPIHVPPIPKPPGPPPIIYSTDSNKFQIQINEKLLDNERSIPNAICIPEEKTHLVQHLDPKCFHYTQGRYYGLLSNNIADPQFVGPNAPGIAGVNLSGGTGLATAYVGSSNSGGGSSSNNSNTNNSGNSGSNSGGGGSSNISNNKKSSASGEGLGSGKDDLSGSSKSGSKSKNSKNEGTSPTATSLELKRIMEKGGELAENMRNCIIRAAVFSSRTGIHNGSFVGCNGETYPDVSKAFSVHGNLRPCNRCKSNKQGAYHCRLRRKHKEADYDGGDSATTLSPFFDIPVEKLINYVKIRPKEVKSN